MLYLLRFTADTVTMNLKPLSVFCCMIPHLDCHEQKVRSNVEIAVWMFLWSFLIIFWIFSLVETCSNLLQTFLCTNLFSPTITMEPTSRRSSLELPATSNLLLQGEQDDSLDLEFTLSLPKQRQTPTKPYKTYNILASSSTTSVLPSSSAATRTAQTASSWIPHIMEV